MLLYSRVVCSFIHSLAFDMAQLKAPVPSVHLLSFAIAVLILASKSQARYNYEYLCGTLFLH